MSSVIGAFVLDFDGVLADSMPAQEQAWKEATRQVNSQLHEEQKRRLIRNLWAGYAGSRMFEGTQLTRSLQHQLREVKDEIWAERMDAVLPVKGAVDGVHQLGKLAPLTISTTAPRSYVESNLQKYGILNEFVLIVTDADVPNPKPAPDALLQIARFLSVEPRMLLMVGDTFTDQEMANRAGSQFALLRIHESPQMIPEGIVIYTTWPALIQDITLGRIAGSES